MECIGLIIFYTHRRRDRKLEPLALLKSSATSSRCNSKKVILVIGGTGEQGGAVVKALLRSGPDATGSSPYTVRVLTRDPQSAKAQELSQKGVDVRKGSVEDLASVLRAMEGAYGVYANTDSMTLGEMKEIYIGMRLFELAKQAGTVEHYVWSSLDYTLKLGGYDPKYRSGPRDGKARVADWMRAQPSANPGTEGMTWSILTTAMYMDMLRMPIAGPVHKREDGTFVFAAPMDKGYVPMVSLSDIGFFARHIFDNREAVSGQELKITSELVTWPYLVETFTRVTGQPAVHVPLSVEEWLGLWREEDLEKPFQHAGAVDAAATNWREWFINFWPAFRESIIQRDVEWVRRMDPGYCTLDGWMKESGYAGQSVAFVKNTQEGKFPRLDAARVSVL